MLSVAQQVFLKVLSVVQQVCFAISTLLFFFALFCFFWYRYINPKVCNFLIVPMDQDDQNYNNNARSSNLGSVRSGLSADARRQDFQSHAMGPPGAPPPHRPRGKWKITLYLWILKIFFGGFECQTACFNNHSITDQRRINLQHIFIRNFLFCHLIIEISCFEIQLFFATVPETKGQKKINK